MSFWDTASIGTPLLLAVLGAIVTVVPLPPAPSVKMRALLVVAFILLGLGATVATVISQREHDRELERKITGGDCFLTFGIIGAPSPRGSGSPYPLEMFGGCAVLYDVTYWVMHASPPGAPPEQAINFAQHPIAQKHMDTVMTYAYDTGVSLPPGEYWIRVIARNGRTEEKLIVNDAGFDGQIFYVQKETANGLALLKCEPIAYCKDHLTWAFPKH
jgi:hypothetical protein